MLRLIGMLVRAAKAERGWIATAISVRRLARRHTTELRGLTLEQTWDQGLRPQA
jgi:hypothetical protein